MNKQEIETAVEIIASDKKAFEAVNHGGFTNKIKAFKSAISALEQQLTNGWIPVSERLPELPDGRSCMNLNATILSPSGLRNAVPLTWELKRGEPTWCYLGRKTDWNVIAWQPLPEPWKEVSELEKVFNRR